LLSSVIEIVVEVRVLVVVEQPLVLDRGIAHQVVDFVLIYLNLCLERYAQAVRRLLQA